MTSRSRVIGVLSIYSFPMQTNIRFPPNIMGISNGTNQIYGCFLKMCKVMQNAIDSQVSFLNKPSISILKSIINLRINVRQFKIKD